MSARPRVFQLNVSAGGVPKRAVARAQLRELGFEGDGVAHPRVHGGRERAVCLYAVERVLALQHEGHTIFPGALGENVTTADVPWEEVVPGARLEMGEALLEVTSFATPCKTTAPFVSGDMKRYHQEHFPSWSRVYARVLRGGSVAAGDAVRLTPP